MTDFDAMVMSGADYGEFSKSFGSVCRELPREMANRLSSILKNYFASYGFDGVYQRMNGRTVAQIFSEYQGVDVKPIASGEVDGMRYNLYEGSRSEATTGEDAAEE
jgi:hypothetical protein